MLETIKTNKAGALIFNVVLGITLFSFLFFLNQPAEYQLLSNGLLQPLSANIPTWIQYSLSFLFYLITIWYSNFVVTKHQLLGRGSQLTGFFCIILLAVGPNFQFINIVAPSTLLIIRFFDRCFEIQKSTKPNPLLFDASFLVAILTILYTPFILLIILVWLAGLYSGNFSIKSWLLSIFTVLIAFYLFLGTYYLMGFTYLPTLTLSYNQNIIPEMPLIIGVLSLLTLLIVLALPTTFSVLRFSKVVIRNHLNLLLWSIPILLLIFLSTKLNFEYYVSLLFFPLAIILGQYFLKAKKQKLANWALIALTLTVLGYQIARII